MVGIEVAADEESVLHEHVAVLVAELEGVLVLEHVYEILSEALDFRDAIFAVVVLHFPVDGGVDWNSDQLFHGFCHEAE